MRVPLSFLPLFITKGKYINTDWLKQRAILINGIFVIDKLIRSIDVPLGRVPRVVVLSHLQTLSSLLLSGDDANNPCKYKLTTQPLFKFNFTANQNRCLNNCSENTPLMLQHRKKSARHELHTSTSGLLEFEKHVI